MAQRLPMGWISRYNGQQSSSYANGRLEESNQYGLLNTNWRRRVTQDSFERLDDLIFIKKDTISNPFEGKKQADEESWLHSIVAVVLQDEEMTKNLLAKKDLSGAEKEALALAFLNFSFICHLVPMFVQALAITFIVVGVCCEDNWMGRGMLKIAAGLEYIRIALVVALMPVKWLTHDLGRLAMNTLFSDDTVKNCKGWSRRSIEAEDFGLRSVLVGVAVAWIAPIVAFVAIAIAWLPASVLAPFIAAGAAIANFLSGLTIAEIAGVAAGAAVAVVGGAILTVAAPSCLPPDPKGKDERLLFTGPE